MRFFLSFAGICLNISACRQRAANKIFQRLQENKVIRKSILDFMQQILTLKKLFQLEWFTTNLTELRITWKHSLSYSKMKFWKYSLKYIWDIQQKQALGRRPYRLQLVSLRAQRDPCWSRAANCDSEHTKVQFFVPWLLLTYTRARCHSSPSTATRSATLQRAATAQARTQTNRRGNWSRNTIQMNSGQASPSYQTIPTRMPGRSYEEQ